MSVRFMQDVRHCLYHLLMLLPAAAMGACAAATMGPELPAVLTSGSVESRAELQHIVSASLQGVPVTLADDALTRDSLLVIERAPARTSAGQRIDARESTAPEQFRLVRHGSQCVLIHVRTGQRTTLRLASCRAV